MIDIGISFTAQPIRVTPYPRLGETTHRLSVGNGGISINIDPATARQWIGALEPVAKESEDASTTQA